MVEGFAYTRELLEWGKCSLIRRIGGFVGSVVFGQDRNRGFRVWIHPAQAHDSRFKAVQRHIRHWVTNSVATQGDGFLGVNPTNRIDVAVLGMQDRFQRMDPNLFMQESEDDTLSKKEK